MNILELIDYGTSCELGESRRSNVRRLTHLAYRPGRSKPRKDGASREPVDLADSDVN